MWGKCLSSDERGNTKRNEDTHTKQKDTQKHNKTKTDNNGHTKTKNKTKKQKQSTNTTKQHQQPNQKTLGPACRKPCQTKKHNLECDDVINWAKAAIAKHISIKRGVGYPQGAVVVGREARQQSRKPCRHGPHSSARTRGRHMTQ